MTPRVLLKSSTAIAQTLAQVNFLSAPSPKAPKRDSVGLAPMSQSSGMWQGKTWIQGDDPNLRHAIFMPASVAIRSNPDLKAKYHQLVAAGTEKKVAITAVMRKLLILANSLLRDHRN